ncbi:MAG: CPXCG motif-containing cysteine-rich protein [Gammaproteobacteria bacterium]|nr:CPXCG motif-containing cysteine-rich protein [Gammaproteobacteria bacterium]
MLQDTVSVTCPHCWESITLQIDLSAGDQSYVEDCSVCCAPILVNYTVKDGELTDISVDRES